MKQTSSNPDPRPTDAQQRSKTDSPREVTGPFGGKAIRLGRVLGIDIGLDLSWIFIFLLITFSLAQGFSQQHGQWGWMF